MIDLYVTLGIVGMLVGALLVFIHMRPTNFRIERSAQIGAPPEVVFPLIDDFHQWVKWSPFEKTDPNMTKTFEGPAAGPGAIYSWTGNKNAGAGRTTILESNAGEFVSIKLEMFRPFACANHVTFKLVPNASGTRVSWIMEGKNNFIVKAFSLVMSMDAMVGKEFEEGLANLDALARNSVAARTA
jgi:Polyketide cyclase / dehydrase and lipid transport